MNISNYLDKIDAFLKKAEEDTKGKKMSDDQRKAMFADLASKGKLRRQKAKPETKGKSINTKKDNSSIGQDKPKEKATMELIELKQELESVYSDVVQKHKEYKNSEDGTDKQYAAMQKFNNAVKRRDELRMKIREIETGVEQTMGGGYEGITAKDIDTTPMKRDPEHEKRIRDTDEWQRKHDSD